MSHFDYYGRIADAGVEDIQQNGRYPIQREAEALVPFDVEKKLDVKAEDTLLDVGCGMGLNLLHLASKAKHVTGCDHSAIIDRLSLKAESYSNVSLIGQDFLSADFEHKFSKILIYSVFPALPTMEVAYQFIEKAIELMSDNGMVLIGDIANVDKKDRFLQSEKGKIFQQEWNALRANAEETDEVSAYQDKNDSTAVMNDQTVLDMIKFVRDKGLDAYILNQSQELPFGHTREDILIVGSEYAQA